MEDAEAQLLPTSQNQNENQLSSSVEPLVKKKRRSKARKSKSKSSDISSEKDLSAFDTLKKGIKANKIDFRDHFEELGKEIGVHDYKVIALLGVGSQGRVYLVQLMHTKELFAMKVFLKEQIIDHAKTTRSVLTEQRFLSSTDHPFITKLFHSFQSAERLFMVMEYCPGGELWTVIKRQPSSRLSETQVRFYASEVLLVLEYTHSRGYIYRDLKPENILLHLDGHIRMADFGLSKQSDKPPEMKVLKKERSLPFFHSSRNKVDLAQGVVIKTDSLVGSVHYLAPEVLAVHGSYDVMADWWSFGVLLYDMLYGVPPFQGRCNEEIIMKILQADFTFHDNIPISSELKSLIKGLLKVEPSKRMCAKRGANDIKKHAFFEGLQWPLLRSVKPPIIPTVIHPEDTSNFELYEEDDCDILFDFFSELTENDEALTKEEQKNFEEFQFARESFVRDIVGDIQEKGTGKKQKSKKRSGPARSRSEIPKKKKKRTRKVAGTMTKAQAKSVSESNLGPRRKSMGEINCLEYDNFVGQNEEYFSNSVTLDTDSIGERDKSSWPGVGNISPHLQSAMDPSKERSPVKTLPVITVEDYDQVNMPKIPLTEEIKKESSLPVVDEESVPIARNVVAHADEKGESPSNESEENGDSLDYLDASEKPIQTESKGDDAKEEEDDVEVPTDKETEPIRLSKEGEQKAEATMPEEEEEAKETSSPKEKETKNEEIKEAPSQIEEKKKGEEEEAKEIASVGVREREEKEEKKKKKKKRSLKKKLSSELPLDAPKKETSKRGSKKSAEETKDKESEKIKNTTPIEPKSNSFTTRKFLNKSAKRKPQRKE